MWPFSELDRLEQLTVLDPVVKPLRKAVARSVKPPALADALHGTWLGHPLHAVLVQVPIGSFVSASLLDVAVKQTRSADLLAATGVVSALPAALAGATDWSTSNPDTQRTGLVHALLNTVGLGLWVASLAARATGNRAAATRRGLLGTAVIGVSGTIGGHLSYRTALGANHNAEIADIVPGGWTVVGADDLAEGTPVVRDVEGTPVLLVRQGSTVSAIANRCSHQSGPLNQGTFENGCVTCPWHGSAFRVTDGTVVHGPAVHPQPVFDVRRIEGRLEVKLRR